MATYTTASLITRVRSKADQADSLFCTDTEIRDWLNEGIAEAHDLLIESFNDYAIIDNTSSTAKLSGLIASVAGSTITGSGSSFTTELNVGSIITWTNNASGAESATVVTIVSDTSLTVDDTPGATTDKQAYTTNADYDVTKFPINLPPDFYKLAGVDLTTGGSTVRVLPFTLQQRNVFNSPSFTTAVTLRVWYNIRGEKMHLIPNDQQSGTIKIWYYPAATVLDDNTTSWTISNVPVVDQYVVTYAAIQCLQKEESDTEMQVSNLERISRKIEEAARKRDSGEVRQISRQSTGTHIWDEGGYW